MVENEQNTLPKRTFRLSSGQEIASVGLGTDKRTDPLESPLMIYKAIKYGGYRLLDCAAIYKNEELVGEGIEKVL